MKALFICFFSSGTFRVLCTQQPQNDWTKVSAEICINKSILMWCWCLLLPSLLLFVDMFVSVYPLWFGLVPGLVQQWDKFPQGGRGMVTSNLRPQQRWMVARRIAEANLFRRCRVMKIRGFHWRQLTSISVCQQFGVLLKKSWGFDWRIRLP